MKISSCNQKNNFNGIPIIKTVLQKEICKDCCKPIETFVSLMEKTDLNNAGMRREIWDKSKYGATILFDACEKFKNPTCKSSQHFLFVESPQETSSHNIKALASFSVNDYQVKLEYLQSLRPHEGAEHVKGAGMMILYTLSKIAEKLNKSRIKLSALTKPRTLEFYRSSGMIERKHHNFILPSSMFKDFQQKIEAKFPVLNFFEESIK